MQDGFTTTHRSLIIAYVSHFNNVCQGQLASKLLQLLRNSFLEILFNNIAFILTVSSLSRSLLIDNISCRDQRHHIPNWI